MLQIFCRNLPSSSHFILPKASSSHFILPKASSSHPWLDFCSKVGFIKFDRSSLDSRYQGNFLGNIKEGIESHPGIKESMKTEAATHNRSLSVYYCAARKDPRVELGEGKLFQDGISNCGIALRGLGDPRKKAFSSHNEPQGRIESSYSHRESENRVKADEERRGKEDATPQISLTRDEELRSSEESQDKGQFGPDRKHRETRNEFEERSDWNANDDENDKIKPFTQIPGPRPLPLVGNALIFSSFGHYCLRDFWSACRKMFNDFGPIVRFSKVTKNLDIVYIFEPKDLQKLFKEESSLPLRPELEILSFYRRKRSSLFSSAGLVTENGPEWRRLRSEISALLKTSIVTSYQTKQADVTDSLVEAIEILQEKALPETWLEKSFSPDGSGEGGHVENLLPLLFKYTLEAVGVVCLGKRLGCLEKGNLSRGNSSRSSKIIDANERTLKAISKSLFSPPFFRLFPTANYLRLSRAQDFIARVVQEELDRLVNFHETDGGSFQRENPLIASLLENDRLSMKDTLLLLIEVLQGGIDATATTLAFCIYFITRNETLQEALHEEVSHCDIRLQPLQGMPLLKATLKETYRMRPSAAAVGRILQKDIVFSGYRVPSGVLVQGPPWISCRDPSAFHRPGVFDPFRWLRANEKYEMRRDHHPYAVLPFSHGSRMCPGRRLAEQEVYLALIKLIQTYKMRRVGTPEKTSQEDGHLGQVMRLNMMPDGPISVRFTKRN